MLKLCTKEECERDGRDEVRRVNIDSDTVDDRGDIIRSEPESERRK